MKTIFEFYAFTSSESYDIVSKSFRLLLSKKEKEQEISLSPDKNRKLLNKFKVDLDNKNIQLQNQEFAGKKKLN